LEIYDTKEEVGREGWGGRAKQSFMTSKTPPGIEKFENVLTAGYILR
jgi:hypothetical protein